MAIDPNIALSVRGPQFESPINAMRNAMEIGAYQNKMQQQQQALQQQQQLRNFLSNANLNDPTIRNKLNVYDPSGETFKNVEAGYETRGKGEMDTFKLALAKYSEFRNRLGGLASTNASRDEVISEVRNAVQQGLLTPELGKYFEDTLPTNPVQLQTRLIRGARENASPEQIVAMFAPKIESQDTGGGGRLLRVNAYENKAEVIPGSEFTKPPSASEAETRRHNLAMEDIAQQRVNRAPTVGQTEKAKIDAKFAASAPQAIQDAENAIKLIDQMVGTGKKGSNPHPGFSGAVGAGIGTRFIPGTDAASFEAMHNQLLGGAFLQAYETLRGGGQITEIEGQKATAARNRMNLAQSEKEYIKAAREYQDVLKSVITRAKQRMGSATDVVDVGADSDWTDL